MDIPIREDRFEATTRSSGISEDALKPSEYTPSSKDYALLPHNGTSVPLTGEVIEEQAETPQIHPATDQDLGLHGQETNSPSQDYLLELRREEREANKRTRKRSREEEYEKIIKEKDNSIDELKSKIRERDKKIDELNTTIKKKCRECDILRAENGKLRSKNQGLPDEFDDLRHAQTAYLEASDDPTSEMVNAFQYRK